MSVKAERILQSYIKFIGISIMVVFLLLFYFRPIDSVLVKEILTFGFFLMLLLFILRYNKNISIVVKVIFVLTFVCKAIYSYITYVTIVSPFPDSINYLGLLQEIIAANTLDYQEIKAIIGSNHVGYEYLMYIVYKLFDNVYSLSLVNVFLYNCSLLLFFRHVNKWFNRKVATLTIIILLFSMNMLIFTSNVLKDSLVVFLAMLSIYLYDKLNEANSKKHKLLLTVFLILVLLGLLMTRIYAAVAFAAAIILDKVLDIGVNTKKTSSTSTRSKLLIIMVSAVVMLILANTPLNSYLRSIVNMISESGDIPSIVADTLKGVLRIFFSPFPWNMTDELQVYTVVIIDSTFFMCFSFTLVLLCYKAYKYKDLRRKVYFYFLPLVIHAAALGVAYDSSSMRQRVAVFMFIPLFYVLGVFYRPENNRDKQEFDLDTFI